MNRDLEARGWCAGTAYSLADIAVGCCTGWLAFRFSELGWRAECPMLARHHEKLMDRSTFMETLPSD